MAEALRIIRERDGLRGLRRGILPRVLTVAPSTAISWMSYEFFSESPLRFQIESPLDWDFGEESGIVLTTATEVLIRQKGHMPETGQAV